MTKRPTDIGRSVQARLLKGAKERGEDFQYVLTRYANERFLYRLASSPHAADFVLKGATLFVLWTGEPHRTTKDVDLLGFGSASEERIHGVMRDLVELDVEDDGIVFDAESIHVGPIRDDQRYGGLRVTMTAHIAKARIRIQIDIGFGDAVTPEPSNVELPGLLDFEPPRLRAYPRETVVAEKLEAMVQLGVLNSRMKDFYDLVLLSKLFVFEGRLLVEAIQATFKRRGTPLPYALPVALTPEFHHDRIKNTQWNAFQRKAGSTTLGSLTEVVDKLLSFAAPPLLAAGSGESYEASWQPGGPWT